MLLIFDKDGTLTETVDGSPCPTTPDNQLLLPGVREMLHLWHNQGDIITVVSNQGAVSFGELTEMESWAIVQELNRLLGGVIRDAKLGFYHPQGPLRERYIDKRKPNPDMILELLADHADTDDPTTFQRSVCFIGNQDTDMQAATYAGIPFKWAHEVFSWNSNLIERQEGDHAGWFWQRSALELYKVHLGLFDPNTPEIQPAK